MFREQEAARARERLRVAQRAALEASAQAAMSQLCAAAGAPPAAMRGEIAAFLTEVLGGDALAGEMLLLHLLSQASRRARGRAGGESESEREKEQAQLCGGSVAAATGERAPPRSRFLTDLARTPPRFPPLSALFPAPLPPAGAPAPRRARARQAYPGHHGLP
jgi:hypothetical protein